MDQEIDYPLFAWLRRGNRRKRILRLLVLNAVPQRPTDIAKALSLSRTMVSATLSELRKMNLVSVLNPNAQRNRFYSPTHMGRDIIKYLDKHPGRTKALQSK